MFLILKRVCVRDTVKRTWRKEMKKNEKKRIEWTELFSHDRRVVKKWLKKIKKKIYI